MNCSDCGHKLVSFSGRLERINAPDDNQLARSLSAPPEAITKETMKDRHGEDDVFFFIQGEPPKYFRFEPGPPVQLFQGPAKYRECLWRGVNLPELQKYFEAAGKKLTRKPTCIHFERGHLKIIDNAVEICEGCARRFQVGEFVLALFHVVPVNAHHRQVGTKEVDEEES